MSEAARVRHLDDLPRLEQSEGAVWRPIRRTLELTGVAANAYTGEADGDEVIEPHDELSPNAGGHEELYFVASGRATFVVDGEETDAPAGTLLAIDVGVQRQAHATEPETTVIVLGGKPGSALPPAPFEYWYAAEPHYLAGEYERGIEVLSEGLEHHPRSPGINYQLACSTRSPAEPRWPSSTCGSPSTAPTSGSRAGPQTTRISTRFVGGTTSQRSADAGSGGSYP